MNNLQLMTVFALVAVLAISVPLQSAFTLKLVLLMLKKQLELL